MDSGTLLTAAQLFCAAIEAQVTDPAVDVLAQLDLTGAQYAALRYIRLHRDPSGGGLAAGLGISNAAATKTIDRLEAKGLVCRKSDPDDRRAMRIELSPRGLEVADRVASSEQQRFAAIIGRMQPEALNTLRAGLESFLQAALQTPEDIDMICLRCGFDHRDDCPGSLLYRKYTGRPKTGV